MPSAGFEPHDPSSQTAKTYALDRMATGIGWQYFFLIY
jgi:hypothetical protein